MKTAKRLSLVLVMICLFSVSYLVTSASAQGGPPGGPRGRLQRAPGAPGAGQGPPGPPRGPPESGTTDGPPFTQANRGHLRSLSIKVTHPPLRHPVLTLVTRLPSYEVD